MQRLSHTPAMSHIAQCHLYRPLSETRRVCEIMSHIPSVSHNSQINGRHASLSHIPAAGIRGTTAFFYIRPSDFLQFTLRSDMSWMH